ncbi:PrgI family protein [Candidatus Parcubacteria bacterium]|nr:PrgI family protein [Candidatus Parcubacteria bacterium]
MQYQVPQFIEVEDKIFGPLTLRQFIYLAGGGGLCLIFFTLLNFYIAVILAMPVIVASLSLAFYKFNGRPLIVALEHAFGYFFGTKLYLWKQREAKTPTQAVAESLTPGALVVPKLSQSRLKDLAWSLNIKDRTTMGVTSKKPSGFEL